METMILNEVVTEAVKQTKEKAGGYYTSVIKQRLVGNEVSAGSFFVGFNSVEQLEAALINANWEVAEGSLESGKLILVTTDFKGKEGIVLASEIDKSKIVEINPKNIEGRNEQAIYVESTENFVEVQNTYMIISTFDPATQTVNVDSFFIPTVFPGSLIGPDDTLVGGKYVKMLVK